MALFLGLEAQFLLTQINNRALLSKRYERLTFLGM